MIRRGSLCARSAAGGFCPALAVLPDSPGAQECDRSVSEMAAKCQREMAVAAETQIERQRSETFAVLRQFFQCGRKPQAGEVLMQRAASGLPERAAQTEGRNIELRREHLECDPFRKAFRNQHLGISGQRSRLSCRDTP